MLQRLTYPYNVGQHILAFDTDSGSIFECLANAGVDIHQANRMIDAVGANTKDAALLGVNEGAPLLCLRRRAYTINGTPIEWSDDRYLPEHARFASTAVRGGANGLSMSKGL